MASILSLDVSRCCHYGSTMRCCAFACVVSDVFATANFPRKLQPWSRKTNRFRAPPPGIYLFTARLLGSIAYLLILSHSDPIVIEAGRATEFRKGSWCGVLDYQGGCIRMMAPEWLSRPRPLRAIPASDVWTQCLPTPH